jgi:cation diffusion facilitator family transporter
MVVAVALMAAAAGIAIKSVMEIAVPRHAPAPFTLIVLVLIVALKESLFRVVFSVGERVHSTALRADAWHHRSDAITSTAAFIGISIALLGGKGYESADDWAALFASFVIAFNGYRFLVPAIREIMDAAPSSHIEQQIREVAGKVEGVVDLEKCFVRKMGLEYYVDLHVGVDGNVTVRQGHDIAHNVKDAIMTSNSKISDVMVHIEPGNTGRGSSGHSGSIN